MSSTKNVIKDNYNMMLLNDYLRVKIKEAGYSGVDISKTPTGTRVALHVTRPGIVIGRKGTGIRDLTEILAKNFGLKNPQLSVVEINKPELSASVMCNRLASHIERGTAFRRATMWTLKQIMENGAMGVQITCSGKLRGDRSSFEKHTAGILPRAGHHAEVIVNEDIAHVETPMGLIGIRIRIARKDKVVPEFELKDKATIKQKKAAPKVEEKEEEEEKEIVITEEIAEEIVAKELEKKKPRTESEQILLEAEQMKNLETLEEVEEKLK
jgi:small subunit ribosomal protein S3